MNIIFDGSDSPAVTNIISSWKDWIQKVEHPNILRTCSHTEILKRWAHEANVSYMYIGFVASLFTSIHLVLTISEKWCTQSKYFTDSFLPNAVFKC